jgi:competence protein ComGC
MRNRRGQILTLIEILVVVAILVGLAAVLIPRYTGIGGAKGPGQPASPKERAQAVDCMNNLKQIRDAIEIYLQTGDKPPASLTELESSGITGKVTTCAVSGTPYSYDPGQGKVWCTTPGHEGY